MTNTQLIRDKMSEKIINTAENIALTEGAHAVNVRMILQTLGITNRVFYNRFHNIDEVLEIVYERTIMKMRTGMMSNFDPDGDFFTQVIEVVSNTLVLSYETKMKLSQYVFENDSASNENFIWWKTQIKGLILLGQGKGHIKELDADVMSYAIWCFIRGYNADALARKLPRDEAIENFKYSFSVLLDGMKK